MRLLLALALLALPACSTLLPASVTERVAETIDDLCTRTDYTERQIVVARINKDNAAKGHQVALKCGDDPPPLPTDDAGDAD